MATAPNTYLGVAGAYLPYTPLNSTASVPSSLELIELGSFTTAPASAAPNANVTSSFTVDVSVTLPAVSSPVVFAGSITPASGGQYDFTFNTGSTYFWSADPNGPATFDVQNVGTCNSSLMGCYTVGIEPLQINSAGKTTGLWAFIGPANLTTPEPSASALLLLPTLVLFLLALRRKLRPQRN